MKIDMVVLCCFIALLLVCIATPLIVTQYKFLGIILLFASLLPYHPLILKNIIMKTINTMTDQFFIDKSKLEKSKMVRIKKMESDNDYSGLFCNLNNEQKKFIIDTFFNDIEQMYKYVIKKYNN
jgi:hypothetical protein